MTASHVENNQLIQAVFERSSNPMLLADDDRCYTAVNDAATRLLRYEKQKLLSMRIDDLTPPDNRDGIDELWCSFLTLGTMTGRFDLLTGDGRLVGVDFNATANVMPGQHLSICVVPPAGDAPDTDDSQDEPETDGSSAVLRPREIEVLTRLALGDTGERIAADLGISKETVRVHIRNAMASLDATTRVQAIGIAIRDNLIELP